MHTELNVTIMSGVDDGTLLRCSVANGDGRVGDHRWIVTIGRHDNNDICLSNDSFVSRYHAQISVEGRTCWLEDRNSTNGTYLETASSEDEQILQAVRLNPGQLFRVGRTWLRIEAYE